MTRDRYNTNLASEFYVISLLHRMGLDANLTLGNKKAVDIVVVRRAGDVATIDVKAVAGKFDWPMSNVSSTARANHFIALLTYDGQFENVNVAPRAWVLPHVGLLGLVKSAKPPSKMRYVSRSDVLKLSKYENAWTQIGDGNAV